MAFIKFNSSVTCVACLLCATPPPFDCRQNILYASHPPMRVTGFANLFLPHLYNHCILYSKGKAVPLQAWSGPESSRKLRFPDYMTTAQDGGKVVSLTHRPPLPPGNAPGSHFCQRLSRPQGHSAIERIMSMENSKDTIWNRTSDLPICSTVP
jgi:hypothetical protein